MQQIIFNNLKFGLVKSYLLKIAISFFAISFISSLSYGQIDTNSKVRIVVFNSVGQKENIKNNQRISIVYGPAIKPEHTYLSYSNGRSRDEYIIELQSFENYLREINRLRIGVDSLRNQLLLSKNEKVDTVEIIKEIEKKSSNSHSRLGVYDIIDSLRNEAIEREKLDILSRIPKINSSSDADSMVIKANINTINRNNQEIERNQNRIDTLLFAIEESKRTGIGLESIDDFYKEIEQLRARNQEIEQINEKLIYNNSILSADLRARNAEYDALIRMIYLLVAIVLIFLMIAIFIYFSYRQKKKFNSELNKINTDLERINNILTISNNEKSQLLRIIRKELDTASKYVASLLPAPILKGAIKSDWIFIPSAQLGGDAFGYNFIDDDNIAIYFVDVSGHGVGSALHSVQVLNILRNRTLPNVDFNEPKDVLTELNNIFQMSNYSGVYFTMFYASYNLKDRTLKYSGAGHPPMILKSGNIYKSLESQNIFIGAVPDISYSSDCIQISKGSSLSIFSDGAFEFERTNKDMYTFDEFKQDFISIVYEKKKPLSDLYLNAKNISRLEELDDDFSVLKIDFD